DVVALHLAGGCAAGDGDLVAHHRPRLALDRKVEHVWAAVVTRDVELPARADQLARVVLRVQDLLALADRAGDDPAIRVDDRAVARVQPLARRVQVLRLEAEAVRDVVAPQRDAGA